jgi:hypothetical protein
VSITATRAERGLELFRIRGSEIEPLGHGKYFVPGECEDGYTVDLDVFSPDPFESCQCADFVYRLKDLPEAMCCKHIHAASFYRAKSRARVRGEQHKREVIGKTLLEIALAS